MGGILFDMSTHGVDQDFAQRLTANRSLRHAQQAIFFSSFISISVGLLFLGVGALLWTFYQSHPFPATVRNADHLFAHFIVTYFPAGLKGLMVAGVVAATMSTLDSTINALCATVYNDILPHRKKFSLSTYFLIDNAAITLLSLVVAVLASQSDGLLLLGIKIQTWTAGSLLAVFVSRVIFPRYFNYPFSKGAVLGAYAFGIAGVATNSLWLKGNWNWNTYFGFGLALGFLYVLSHVLNGSRNK
jgi:Na+/proline symporter